MTAGILGLLIKNRLLAGLLLSFSLITNLQAKELGTIGTTYEMAEPDMEEYIQDKLSTLDLKETMKKVIEETKKQIIPKGINLPKVVKEKTFYIDPTRILNEEIRNAEGKIIFPKGFQYNVLDYSPLTRKILFIDGDDPDQLEIANKYEDQLGDDVLVLLVNGNPEEIEGNSDSHIKFAKKLIIDGFQIKMVPSLASQEGKRIKVEELIK